ncbi:MAG: hypothetical protein GKR87_11180 [Kiritimatiellae bacterium]|nr:hypothetical protein [Kiritimatiellia bacterium]
MPYLDRRSLGHKHPVYDFLFEYYTFRPSLLMRWSPGIDQLLEGEKAKYFLKYPEYSSTDNGIWLDPAGFPTHRIDSFRWVIQLLEITYKRPPRFGCFGLHEWAMVYKQSQDQIRHPSIKLRLPPEKIEEVVMSQKIVYSHFDAFRFFAPSARSLNQLNRVQKIGRIWNRVGVFTPTWISINGPINFTHGYRVSTLQMLLN